MREHALGKERQPRRARFMMMTPGQGSQFAGMGMKLAEHPAAAAVFREADEILGFPLSERMLDPSGEALKDNAIVQPAIVAATIAANELFLAEHPEMANVIPQFYIGHSLGELTALYFAGVLRGQDALIIAHERGKLMQLAAEQTPGGMITIRTEKDLDKVRESDMLTVDNICKQTGVYLATYNSSAQVSISGLADNIAEAARLLKETKFQILPLKNVPPSHTPYMRPAMEKLMKFLNQSGIVFRDPNSPVLLNLTGKEEDQGEVIKRALVAQLVNPVRFEQGINFGRSQGVGTYMEFGAKSILSGFIPYIYGKHAQEYFSTIPVYDLESAKAVSAILFQ